MKKLLVVLLSLVAVITFFSCNNTPVVEQVEEPVFLTEEGAIKSGDSVELSCNTAGATIYYTTSKTTTPQEYKGKITVSEAMTISAYATKSGWKDSGVVTASYTIMPELKLTFTVNNKAVDEGTTLYLIDGEVGVGFECSPTDVVPKIYYTTNGEEPTEDSTLYKGTFFIDKEMTIKACAIAEDCVEDKATLNFALKGESPEVMYTIISDEGKKELHLWTRYEKSKDSQNKIRILYVVNGEGFPKEYESNLSIDGDATYTVWAEKDGCNPGPEKDIICGPDKIYMGDDGCIHVHFGEPQPVKVSTASVGSETYVEYATCESAFPVLKDLPSVTSTFRNFVKMLALVSNDYDEDEYVAQDFILSLSAEGSVLDLLKAVMESVFGGVVTVQFSGDALVVLSTEGVALVNIPIKGVKLNGVIPFSPYQWDGLAISPIYVTKDLYGLVMDLLTQNLGHIWKNKKGEPVAATPLTTFAITNESGKTIVEKNFPKLSARVQYFVNSDSSHSVTFAKEFYNYDSLADRIQFAKDYKEKLKTETDISIEVIDGKLDKTNCLITETSIPGIFERKSYGVVKYLGDSTSESSEVGFIVLRTEYLTTKTDTDILPKEYYATKTDILITTDNITVKTGLDTGVNYIVCMMTKTGASEPSIADLFYVTAEDNVHKLAEGNLNPKKDVVVIATGKEYITGYCNHITGFEANPTV